MVVSLMVKIVVLMFDMIVLLNLLVSCFVSGVVNIIVSGYGVNSSVDVIVLCLYVVWNRNGSVINVSFCVVNDVSEVMVVNEK